MLDGGVVTVRLRSVVRGQESYGRLLGIQWAERERVALG